jgi:hypothetical protein
VSRTQRRGSIPEQPKRMDADCGRRSAGIGVGDRFTGGYFVRCQMPPEVR